MNMDEMELRLTKIEHDIQAQQQQSNKNRDALIQSLETLQSLLEANMIEISLDMVNDLINILKREKLMLNGS